MNTLDLSILPEVVEDMIYKYHHQMMFSSVMDELKYVSKTLQQKCGHCRKTFVSFQMCECINYSHCSSTFCSECRELEIRQEYEDLLLDVTDEQLRNIDMPDFFDNVIENMECSHCIRMRIQMEHSDDEYDDNDYYNYYSYYGGW
jgi:Mg2+ and Co2+ transporter CorA